MLTQENNQTQLNNTLNVLLTELGEECSTIDLPDLIGDELFQLPDEE